MTQHVRSLIALTVAGAALGCIRPGARHDSPSPLPPPPALPSEPVVATVAAAPAAAPAAQPKSLFDSESAVGADNSAPQLQGLMPESQATGRGAGSMRSKRMGAQAQGLGGVAHGVAVKAPPYGTIRRYAPGPGFNTEGYAHIAENAFVRVTDQALSTFSIDVDTASYSNARRFLDDGRLPPKDAIRVEEWINYFSYSDPEPRGDTPFAITSEISSCPWNANNRLMRLGIKGKSIAAEKVPPRNLVFLIDVSGSMMPENKLPLLKRGLAMLVRTVREQDHVAMVVYAGASGLVLPPTSGADQGRILAALGSLQSGGSTNGGDGIRLAYEVAQRHFNKSGINRVILATDGDFNVGTTSEGELTRLIEEKRKTGVFLTVLGFGEGNVKDATMEMLADKGNGNYAYIDSLDEARKVLVREAGATLVTIAKDVKLQVEFNPTRVASYKLVGYENRLLAKEDFNDDRKDAGEIGAGHNVTALYELVPVGAPEPTLPPATERPKYQAAPGALNPAATSDELATVNIRYKPPTSDTSTKLSMVVKDGRAPLDKTSDDFRFSAAVANAALVLRGSQHLGKTSLDAASRLAAGALGRDPSGLRRQFVELMTRAQGMVTAHAAEP